MIIYSISDSTNLINSIAVFSFSLPKLTHTYNVDRYRTSSRIRAHNPFDQG